MSGNGKQKSKKLRRKPWSEKERSIFKAKLGHFVDKKLMPPTHIVENVVKLLGTRTVAQVRVRVNNFITGKQSWR